MRKARRPTWLELTAASRSARHASRGQTFTITQSGNTAELKSDKGEQVRARVTSPTTLSAGPTWNMLGVVHGATIEWSNGTK
jgi:hypothetical protein